jgi:hypothetical protein
MRSSSPRDVVIIPESFLSLVDDILSHAQTLNYRTSGSLESGNPRIMTCAKLGIEKIG